MPRSEPEACEFTRRQGGRSAAAERPSSKSAGGGRRPPCHGSFFRKIAGDRRTCRDGGELASCSWITRQRNVVITGKTGTGKSYLACALANAACRAGHSTLYRRASRLFDEAAQARADGSWPSFLARLAKVKVLIIDDFGLENLGPPERKTLLEILEDRYNVSSTVVTSQIEPKLWHAVIGDPTLADAIADRLVHNADRVLLEGDSERKLRSRP
jgi:DNA replication protein DnaC